VLMEGFQVGLISRTQGEAEEDILSSSRCHFPMFSSVLASLRRFVLHIAEATHAASHIPLQASMTPMRSIQVIPPTSSIRDTS